MFFKFTIAEGRNPYHGANIILTQYHIRCYTYLYFSLVLDNICILLLNNILAYPLVQDMDTMVKPFNLCNQ